MPFGSCVVLWDFVSERDSLDAVRSHPRATTKPPRAASGGLHGTLISSRGSILRRGLVLP